MNRRFMKACLLLVVVCILAAAFPRAAKCTVESEPKWLGPGIPSEDGNTIIKKAGGGHEIGGLVDLGFFDKCGQQRSVIRGKHKFWSYRLSSDGYLLVFGGLAGREGMFLSQYNPYGNLFWEYKLEQGSMVNYMAVSPLARRVAVAISTELAHQRTGGYLLLIDQSGAELQRYKLGSHEPLSYVAFLSGQKFLMATTPAAVLLFEPEHLGCLWELRGLAVGGIAGDAVISADYSKIALVDAAKVKENEKTKWMLRMRVLDAKTGAIEKDKILPFDESTFRGASRLRYDSTDKAFILETTAGRYSVSSEDQQTTGE
jgi:hypothetical protein